MSMAMQQLTGIIAYFPHVTFLARDAKKEGRFISSNSSFDIGIPMIRNSIVHLHFYITKLADHVEPGSKVRC
jgi:hypothetical protein